MKKTLSILLSLLMVLGTVTCLFTMPVATASAEEAATEVESTVETLPVNDFITNNAVKTITPDTVWTNSGVDYPTSVNYGVNGWNLKTDDAGNVISGQRNSYIDANVYYQITFDVTVSDDINDGVTFRPVFHSNADMKQNLVEFVGMRSDVTTPTKVETAYNLVTNTNSTDATIPSTTAENAATLVAGKTYTYTYILNTTGEWINYIRMVAEGLTAGSVTVGEVKLFPRSESYADNFKFTTSLVSYDVEEDGNVFTRVYALKGDHLYFKEGSLLHDITLKGGRTYDLDMDFRITTDNTAANSPTFDYHIPNKLDYTADFAEVKQEAQTTETDNATDYIISANNTYSNTSRGYSYFYANSGNAATRSRRIFPGLATVKYYSKANGELLYTAEETYGSAQGRNAKTAIYNQGWLNTIYTVNAPNAQSIKEAAIAGAASNNNKYMRYTYKDGTWTYNETQKAYYAPAAQNEVVDFVLANLVAGSVYDFDNISLEAVDNNIVEYKNTDGEVIDLPANETPAKVIQDISTGEYTIKDHDNTDAFTFEGWYVNGVFAGKDAKISVADTDTVKAVIVYENLSGNGSFEQFTTSGVLNQYVSTTGGTKTYTVKTGEFADNEWAMWDKYTTAAAAETAEFLAQYPYITTVGGLNISAKNYKIESAVGTLSTNIGEPDNTGLKTNVSPYRGNAMLLLRAYSRQAVTKVSGLQAGRTYNVSFMTWSPTSHDYISRAFATDNPMYLNNVTNGSDYKVDGVVVTDYLGGTSITMPESNDRVQNWKKVTYTFVATQSTAYLCFNAYNATPQNPSYIDDLVVTEYDCNGNHIYDNLTDDICNACGETRVYNTDWDFEDGITENIYYSNAKVVVKDAVDQPAKIGSKYLEYTTTAFGGMTFNFPYEQGYKYKISYDFKIFAYGTGATSNGIDTTLLKNADGKYGSPSGTGEATAALNPATDNIVTRYYEDGTVYEKVECFNHSAANQGQNNYYGRKEVDGVYVDQMNYGPAELWSGWQHFEIEVGTNNDYEGLVEYGIRPNDAGWVVGIDNFKVEKIATAAIDEANDATNGTYAFNIRAKTSEQKQGLRFKSTIDLDKLNLADGAKIVEYGTLAAKASYADQGYFLRREAADAANAKVVAGVAYNAEDGTDIRYAIDESTNTLTYTGVLTGIGVKNYNVDFIVCGYAIVEAADGTRITVYDEAVTLSVYDAAQQIIDANTNADDVAIAKTVIDTYNAYLAAQ